MTEVVVIGAGLAGSVLTEQLHARGVTVQWWDAGEEGRASSCPCALVHPFAGRSFQPRPDVFEAWVHARRFLRALGPAAQVHEATIVRRIGDDDAGRRLWSSWNRHESQLRAIWDGELEVGTAPDGARTIAYGPVFGVSLAGAVAQVHARLRARGLAPRRLTVDRIVREGEGWAVRDAGGGAPTGAAHVVVAAGAGTRTLLAGHAGAPSLEHVEGTLGHGRAQPLPEFFVDGGHVASTAQTVGWGASYRMLDRPDPRTHETQLHAIAARLEARVPRWPEPSEIWRGVRVVDPHRRRPFVGPVGPATGGLWAMTAFGSQGALWIPWAAARLAQRLANLSSD